MDYARLAREPTARWVAAEDALLDTCICKQGARDICEALDRHLITAAVTGSLRLIPGAAGKGSLPYRLDSQKSGMREGDVDVSAWKETKDTRRHWEKEPGHLVVWWRAKWRCGCCDGRGNERGGGWGGAGGEGGGNITQPLANQDGCGDGSSEAGSSSGRAGAGAAAAESSNGGNPAAARRAVGLGAKDGLSWITNNISHSSENVLPPTPQQQQPQTSRPSNAAPDGDGGSESTQPLACGGGGSDMAQPPADLSDGDGGSGTAQPLASAGSSTRRAGQKQLPISYFFRA